LNERTKEKEKMKKKATSAKLTIEILHLSELPVVSVHKNKSVKKGS